MMVTDKMKDKAVLISFVHVVLYPSCSERGWGAPFSSKINKMFWVSQYALSDIISDKKFEFLPTTLHGYGKKFEKV